MELVGSQTFPVHTIDTDIQMTDYDLIRACLSGNTGLFSGIITRYKRLVYSTIFNMVGDSPDTNDLFQEVFLRAYKSLRTYNPDYRFATWLMKITVNICLDRIRQNKEQSTGEDVEEFADERLNPEDHCIAVERQQRLRKAVAALPEQYRVPLVLFHQEGLSYEAMVEITGEPLTIIKNRLYRARLMLRDRLNPEKENAS